MNIQFDSDYDSPPAVASLRPPPSEDLVILLRAANELFAWLRANPEAANLFVECMKVGGSSKTFLLDVYGGEKYARIEEVCDESFRIRTVASYLADWLNNEAAVYATGQRCAEILRAYKSA